MNYINAVSKERLLCNDGGAQLQAEKSEKDHSHQAFHLARTAELCAPERNGPCMAWTLPSLGATYSRSRAAIPFAGPVFTAAPSDAKHTNLLPSSSRRSCRTSSSTSSCSSFMVNQVSPLRGKLSATCAYVKHMHMMPYQGIGQVLGSRCGYRLEFQESCFLEAFRSNVVDLNRHVFRVVNSRRIVHRHGNVVSSLHLPPELLNQNLHRSFVDLQLKQICHDSLLP